MKDAWNRGALVVLRGAPGIGKTRLATDFVKVSGPVLALKARVDGCGSTYGVLSQLLSELQSRLPALTETAASELARLAPDWGTPPDSPLEQGRSHDAVHVAFKAWRSAGLGAFFADDLQWVDAPSLECLFGLAGRRGSRAAGDLLRPDR